MGTAMTLASTLQHLTGCIRTEQQEQPESGSLGSPQRQKDEASQALCTVAQGLSYQVLSRRGEPMNDGVPVPILPDGMGCFPGKNGNVILVRNHEISPVSGQPSPFPELAYDPNCIGGTTSLVVGPDLKVLDQRVSLTGTHRNCAGGPTPWGTWITCEEIFSLPPGTPGGEAIDGLITQKHGYAFEVNPYATSLQKVMPLVEMGHFRHEAVGVDRLTGIVYQTEDSGSSCFYRFIPNRKAQLHQGGQLQALKILEADRFHTTQQKMEIGKQLPCQWVDIPVPDPVLETVHQQGQERGAAIFVRGEGLWAQEDGIYFSCTSGGSKGYGQIFRYVPKDLENGTIELVYESTDQSLINPDNLTANRWGDVVICEDRGVGTNRILGLTPKGKLYEIATTELSEWTGPCFSPDGQTLFVNLQDVGATVAIQGSWDQLRPII